MARTRFNGLGRDGKLIYMPVDKRGKKLLKAAGYEKFRKYLLRAVAEYIRDNAEVGEDLQEIVGKVLREERFRDFFDSLVQKTREDTKLSKDDASETASILVGEETRRDMERKAPGLVCSSLGRKPQHPSREKLHRKLLRRGVLKGRYSEPAVLWFKARFWEAIMGFFREHPRLLGIISAGGIMIAISAILLGSIYNALVVALTLNAVSTASVAGKIGNIIGALGGVLIFFTSISVVVTYLLEKERRRERVSRLADEYLRETK